MREFFNADVYVYVIVPLLIFFARVSDVSIQTIRLIFVSKGYKYIAPILGFFEVIIWLLAMAQIMQHLDSWICYIAYGAGFGMGNYIGILIEEYLSIGNVLVRVFPKKDTTICLEDLRNEGFAVSAVEIEGKYGKKKMLFSIIKRKKINNFITIVLKHNPNAFYSVEDIKSVSEGNMLGINKNPEIQKITRKRKGK